VGIPPALATASDLIGEAEEGDTAMVGIEVDDQTLKTQKMLEEVGEMVKTKPSDAASIFQRWVQTEN
jgi:flagellar M-ring protein FliF